MIGTGNNFSPSGTYIIQQQETNPARDLVPGKMRELAQAMVSGLSGTNEAAGPGPGVPVPKTDETIQQDPVITQDNNNNVNNVPQPDMTMTNNELGEAPVSFVNNTDPEGYVNNGDDRDYDDRLRALMKCNDKEYVPETLQRGDFWVLKNYVRADHGELKCHESITYTTHADFTFLDNLIPLLER